MTTEYRQVPTYEQPFETDEVTSRPWYRYFQDLDNGKPHSGELPQKVGASPFTYTATLMGSMLVTGGTVSVIAYARGTTFYVTGQTTGLFYLAQGDRLKVTYTVLPTMVYFPA